MLAQAQQSTNTKKHKRKLYGRIYTFCSQRLRLRFSVFIWTVILVIIFVYIFASLVKTRLYKEHKPHTKLPRGRFTSCIIFPYTRNKGRKGSKKVSTASKLLVEIKGQKSLRYLPTIFRRLGGKNAAFPAPRSHPPSGENCEADAPDLEEFPAIWTTKTPSLTS